MRKQTKRTLTPEHIEKMREGVAKARAEKAAKLADPSTATEASNTSPNATTQPVTEPTNGTGPVAADNVTVTYASAKNAKAAPDPRIENRAKLESMRIDLMASNPCDEVTLTCGELLEILKAVLG